MLEFVVLFLLILIIILIMYTYYFSIEKEYKVISKNIVEFTKKNFDKCISYKSDYLTNFDNSVYVIYYDLPVNIVYWTFGFYQNGKCIEGVNMGNYQTIERGDTLAILIGNNRNAINKAFDEINQEHMKNYIYKKLIFHPVYINGDFYINFESYANKFIKSHKVIVKQYLFDDIPYLKFNNKNKKESIRRQCEDLKLFDEAKKIKYITDKQLQLNVIVDTNEEFIPYECLTNKSEIFYVGDKVYRDGIEIPKFKVIAVNHFKSRAALHSHIIFYNALNNKPFRIEITGEISDKINYKDMITIRHITFQLPEEIKAFYVIEYIYYDFSSGNKVNPETIIPFELYRNIN